jgi:hypothetical protein
LPCEEISEDFYQDWASAKNYFEGLPVYTHHAVTTRLYLNGRDPTRGDLEVNAHPPTSVLFFLPLAFLDYPYAFFVWNLVSLLLLFGSIWLVVRELRISLSLSSLCPAVVLILVCTPLRDHLYLGQITLLVVFLVTGVWAADRSGHPWWAGFLLGAAATVKILPFLFFFYFLIRGRLRVVLAGALSVAALTVLTSAILGTDTYRTYILEVMPHVEGFRSHAYNASPTGLWTLLFDPADNLRVEPLWRNAAIAQIGSLSFSIAIICVLGCAAWKARNPIAFDLAFSLTIIGILLVSPITWNHYYLLLIIPLGLCWLKIRSPAAKAVFLGIIGVLLMHPSFPIYLIVLSEPSFTVLKPIHILVRSLPCYALLGLFVFAIIQMKHNATSECVKGLDQEAKRLTMASNVSKAV